MGRKNLLDKGFEFWYLRGSKEIPGMKTYAISIAILSLAAIGCGSSSTSTRGRTLDTGEGGEAGQSVVEQTGGIGNEPVSTGGTGAVPDGMGGSVGVCTPKTCLTFAIETTGSNELNACGLIEDGCGNYIDCGGCESLDRCGGGSLNREDGGENDDGIPNICNGGCDTNSLAPCLDEKISIGCAWNTDWYLPGERVPTNAGRLLLTDCTQTEDPYTWCCDYHL
jgi:hypothetical protein